jgi:hypothetical protein
MAQEESNLLKPELTYEVASPYDSFEAAKTMLEVLEQSENLSNLLRWIALR